MPVSHHDQVTGWEVRQLRDAVHRLEGRVSRLESDLLQEQGERRAEAVHQSLYRERARLTVVAAIACAVVVLVFLWSKGHL